MCEDQGILRVKELTELSQCTNDNGSKTRRQRGREKIELVRYDDSDALLLVWRYQSRMKPRCGKGSSISMNSSWIGL